MSEADNIVIRYCVNPQCPSQRPGGTGREIGRGKRGEYGEWWCKDCGYWSVFNPPMFREEYAVAVKKLPEFPT